MKTKKTQGRIGRHKRIRKVMRGEADRPRLCIFCSHRNITAQLVDDIKQKTVLSLSTLSKDIKGKVKFAGNIKAATLLGQMVAEKAKALGVSAVCFDRGGYRYHGKIKALAEAARKAGLKF